MQSTNSPKLTELDWWWPSPEAFNDLEVEDNEDGWQLFAPDNTELAEWLEYWSQSDEHHALFQEVFVRTMTDYANSVLDNLEQDGKAQDLSDWCQADPEQTEENIHRVQPEY